MNKEKITTKNATINLFWPVKRGITTNEIKKLLPDKKIILQEQVHGDNIVVVDSHSPEIIAGADGMFTKEKGIALCSHAADCQIVFIADEKKPVFGVMHTGWRGILNQSILKMIDQLLNEGSSIEDLKIWISPSIDTCCFQVDANIHEKPSVSGRFVENFGKSVLEKKDGKKYINLRQAQLMTLLQAGLEKEQISIDQRCTVCAKEKFPSHRRDKIKRDGNIIGCIYLK